MSKVRVFHGTHKGFRESVEGGIVPADPRAGVRVTIAWDEAVKHARAVSAFYLVEAQAEPVGLIVEALVDPSTMWERNDLARVKRIRKAEIVKIHVPIRFPEFEPTKAEVVTGKANIFSVKQAANAVDRAYDDFMQLRKAGRAFDPTRSYPA